MSHPLSFQEVPLAVAVALNSIYHSLLVSKFRQARKFSAHLTKAHIPCPSKAGWRLIKQNSVRQQPKLGREVFMPTVVTQRITSSA
jgi:hypothetical protein